MSIYQRIRPKLKKLEFVMKELRPFFMPKAYVNYIRFNKRGLNLPSPGMPCAIFDFKSMEVDYVGGRYFHHLVQDVIGAGYHPVYKNNFRFLATLPYKTFKKLLMKERFGVSNRRSQYPEGSIYFADYDCQPSGVSKFIRVSFKWKVAEPPNEFQLPFAFHPHLQKKESELLKLNVNTRRQKVVFFGGGAGAGHDKVFISKQYKMINRTEALRCIESAIDAGDLPEEDFHLYHTPERRIPADQWMPTMANSQFFLALPGVGMPACHNLVEALAMGAIPILQYAHYFDPPLEHGVNALTYNSREELIRIVKAALQMSADEREKLSQAAINYYMKHLKLGQFTRRLTSSEQDRLTLYINGIRASRVKTHKDD